MSKSKSKQKDGRRFNNRVNDFHDVILEPKIEKTNVPKSDTPLKPANVSKAEQSLNWRQQQTSSSQERTFSSSKGLHTLVQCCINHIGANLNIHLRRLHQLPIDLRDALFYYFMDHGPQMKWEHWQTFIHPELIKLNFTLYSQQTNDITIENYVLPAVKPLEDVDDWEAIDREKITQIYQGTVHLQSLCLSECYKVSSFCIQRILKECQHLTHLDISKCPQIKKITISSQTLRSLNLSRNSFEFELNCPSLTELYLGHHKRMNLHEVAKCTQLEVLDLSACTVDRSANLVTVAGLLVALLPILRVLIVQDCALPYPSLMMIENLKKFPLLEELDFSGCSNVRDTGCELIKLLPGLKKLNLDHCAGLDSPALLTACFTFNPELDLKYPLQELISLKDYLH